MSSLSKWRNRVQRHRHGIANTGFTLMASVAVIAGIFTSDLTPKHLWFWVLFVTGILAVAVNVHARWEVELRGRSVSSGVSGTGKNGAGEGDE